MANGILHAHLHELVYHELGHAVVARQFGQDQITIHLLPVLNWATRGLSSVRGETQATPDTNIQRSVIGWAGYAAECLVKPRMSLSDRYTLGVVRREDDIAKIESLPPEEREEASRTAYTMVQAHWVEVCEIAGNVLALHQSKKMGNGLRLEWSKYDRWTYFPL